MRVSFSSSSRGQLQRIWVRKYLNHARQQGPNGAHYSSQGPQPAGYVSNGAHYSSQGPQPAGCVSNGAHFSSKGPNIHHRDRWTQAH